MADRISLGTTLGTDDNFYRAAFERVYDILEDIGVRGSKGSIEDFHSVGDELVAIGPTSDTPVIPMYHKYTGEVRLVKTPSNLTTGTHRVIGGHGDYVYVLNNQSTSPIIRNFARYDVVNDVFKNYSSTTLTNSTYNKFKGAFQFYELNGDIYLVELDGSKLNLYFLDNTRNEITSIHYDANQNPEQEDQLQIYEEMGYIALGTTEEYRAMTTIRNSAYTPVWIHIDTHEKIPINNCFIVRDIYGKPIYRNDRVVALRFLNSSASYFNEMVLINTLTNTVASSKNIDAIGSDKIDLYYEDGDTSFIALYRPRASTETPKIHKLSLLNLSTQVQKDLFAGGSSAQSYSYMLGGREGHVVVNYLSTTSGGPSYAYRIDKEYLNLINYGSYQVVAIGGFHRVIKGTYREHAFAEPLTYTSIGTNSGRMISTIIGDTVTTTRYNSNIYRYDGGTVFINGSMGLGYLDFENDDRVAEIVNKHLVPTTLRRAYSKDCVFFIFEGIPELFVFDLIENTVRYVPASVAGVTPTISMFGDNAVYVRTDSSTYAYMIYNSDLELIYNAGSGGRVAYEDNDYYYMTNLKKLSKKPNYQISHYIKEE